MSHLNDLAASVTNDDDVWSLSGHIDRATGERVCSQALALAKAATAIATRVRRELDEAERADIRSIYANDPHRSRS